MQNLVIKINQHDVPVASAHQTDFVISLPRSKTALHNMIWQLRACWDFAFGANATKFSSEQGAMRKHSRSYVNEAQRCAEINLARAAQRVNSQHALKKQIEDLRAEQDLQTTQRSAWIEVKVNRCHKRIQIGDIIRCQADGSYTQLHLKDHTSRLITGTHKQIEKKMSAHHFIRCHQSHLVHQDLNNCMINSSSFAKYQRCSCLAGKAGISRRTSVRKLFYSFN